MTTEETSSQTSPQGASGADDIFLFKKYKESLIKGDVLENSKPIIKGVDLKDQTVINTLTRDGSLINDWAKMESVYEYSTDFGSGRIHYYKHLKTAKINYYDAKLKISVPADLKKNLKDPSVVKDGFWIVDVDENFLPTGVRK